jgi:hypothetical protein
MVSLTTYVPILKWKMGEYQALYRLSTATKNKVVPLIEIPPPGYDFDTEQMKKTIDEHLVDFAKRLHSKWDSRSCFIDMHHIDPAARMADGSHFLNFVFDSTRKLSCKAVPVVALDSDMKYYAACKKICAIDKLGACLRLKADDFDGENVALNIKSALEDIGVGVSNVDLVIDLCAANFIPRTAHQGVIKTLLDAIPSLNKWRSIVLVGTSYPETLQKVEKPVARIPRLEWSAYKTFVNKSQGNSRLPSFGDYGVAHPSLNELDMRFVKPFAKLRYTTKDSWYVAQGSTVREHGFEQYRDMCGELMEDEGFDSNLSSAGDEYIASCYGGSAKTGNLSTWVWVATNRHITKVVEDLASLHDSLETVAQ